MHRELRQVGHGGVLIIATGVPGVNLPVHVRPGGRAPVRLADGRPVDEYAPWEWRAVAGQAAVGRVISSNNDSGVAVVELW